MKWTMMLFFTLATLLCLLTPFPAAINMAEDDFGKNAALVINHTGAITRDTSHGYDISGGDEEILDTAYRTYIPLFSYRVINERRRTRNRNRRRNR
ncbi:hypothetical protein JTB14_033241 [Gonioctena quinquepunctata]|nr:hypothetical protein JTB14_033241 [Gonioctena quinquepunctata]